MKMFSPAWLLVLLGCTSDAHRVDTKGDDTSSSNFDTAELQQEFEWESDFQPPQGAADYDGGMGPWNKRLLLAVSDDGLQFTRLNQIVTDQADVPDLLAHDGWLYLYYTGWTVGEDTNRSCVAISDDNGANWIYKKLNLTGFEGMSDPVDPEIQMLPDGIFRLYLTAQGPDDPYPRTHYAHSANGVDFIYQGVAFVRDGEILDPSIIQVGEKWHLYAGGIPQTNLHAISDNGTDFSLVDTFQVSVGGNDYLLDNGIPIDDGYRYFGFYDFGFDIRAFHSPDGYNWQPTNQPVLTVDVSSGLESHNLTGAGVTQLSDGSFIMVYGTKIPTE